MEDIIRNYFQAWIDKKIDAVRETFSEDIVYVESHGPVYQGIDQVQRWFADWNRKGTVLRWDIKQIAIVDKTAFVEWFFRYEYEGNIGECDGVTIARFNDDMKICELKEFQSKSQHDYPYGKVW